MYVPDLMYFVIIAPAFLLGMYAQMKVKSTYAKAAQQPARMSGAAAAHEMLERAGVHGIGIEEIPGQLSDHYDPRQKVLRLSRDVFHGRTLAAVGIAAHEAGHAIQDARHYLPLVIRNAAVPAASFGSSASWILLMIGMMLHTPLLVIAGIGLFGCVVFFQVINLPVEFDASARAKAELVNMGIVNDRELPYVRKVLSAAALTYVAATLQSILTLLYFLSRYLGRR